MPVTFAAEGRLQSSFSLVAGVIFGCETHESRLWCVTRLSDVSDKSYLSYWLFTPSRALCLAPTLSLGRPPPPPWPRFTFLAGITGTVKI